MIGGIYMGKPLPTHKITDHFKNSAQLKEFFFNCAEFLKCAGVFYDFLCNVSFILAPIILKPTWCCQAPIGVSRLELCVQRPVLSEAGSTSWSYSQNSQNRIPLSPCLDLEHHFGYCNLTNIIQRNK